MRISHIYWFAYYSLEEPSVRYRAKYPLEHLRDHHGIPFSLVHPGYKLQNIFHFFAVYFSALLQRKQGSVIVFQKIYSKGIYATALKFLLFFRHKNTLYDIDDAEHTRRPSETIHYFMKRCSACSAGSESLVAYALVFNKNVFLLTSPVLDHGLARINRDEILTLGWLGYYSAHRQSLMDLFFPALIRIEFPVRLLMLGVRTENERTEISNYFSKNENIIVELPHGTDWHNESAVYKTITTFDIGVSPLLDTEFNRAKSAFKLKQCLSCGVPVLASPVGENLRFIQDGSNGYLCDTSEEYYAKMLELRNETNGLYQKLSLNAKATFPSFSIDNYCFTFLEYYRQMNH